MKSKKPLIGLMVLCAAGAVTAGALALNKVPANKTVNDGLDQAIYLYWGEGSSSATISAVENLAKGVKQYRALSVTPRATKSVAGTVTVTFTVEFEKLYSAEGLTISVYEATSVANAEAGVFSGSAVTSVDCSEITYSSTEKVSQDFTTTIDVEAGEDTGKIYSIEFDYNGDDQASGFTFGGTLAANQSFAED